MRGSLGFPSCTFVSFVVDALNPITTKDTKVHEGELRDLDLEKSL
jgi:hypothetical protein